MKFAKLLCIIMALAIILSACTVNPQRLMDFKASDKIANDTCRQIIEAIQKQDAVALKSLFAAAVQDDIDTLEQDIDTLFNFIQGDITFFSQAGILPEYTKNYGERTTIIKASFLIETNTNTYCMAIKECAEDTVNAQNVGIISIYIINAVVWNSDYVYYGGGEWKQGIHIKTTAHIRED